MNKLNTIFKQIRSNIVVKYFYVMAIFHIPSALSRLFISTDHYFQKISPDNSNFSKLMNTIFLYRPFEIFCHKFRNFMCGAYFKHYPTFY